MGYVTVAAGTAITSSWANAEVRDQVVSVFASSAARDSSVTSPVEGMYAYLEDSDLLTYYDGANWMYAPGQVISRARRTTSSSSTTSEVGVLRLAVGPLLAGNIYKIKSGPLWLNCDASAITAARIRYTTDGSTPTTSSTALPGAATQGDTGTNQQPRSFECLYAPASDVDFTGLLTVQRYAGTGNASITASSTNIIEWWVETCGVDTGDYGVDI